MLLRASLFLLACVAISLAASNDQWRSRTIYQLLTDRFATSDGSSPDCNLGNYCGGTYNGIVKHLDYITGMGFDAIWITPIIENTDGGYHGYWGKQWDATKSINTHFGSMDDLGAFVNASHKADVFVMVDQVANHVGPVGNNYGSISPFNQASHYHDCNGCPGDCNINDWNNWDMIEHCRLAGLPDLNQDNSYVHDQLIYSAQSVMSYGFDGMRIDTVPEVKRAFWADFANALNTYTVGEVFTGNMDKIAEFQPTLSGLLDYPMYYAMRDCFAYKKSCKTLGNTYSQSKQKFHDTSLLGRFVDNHDNARFLSQNGGDVWTYKNAIVFNLFADGIPIIYYGTEQGFSGGNDPNNREPLWKTNFNTQGDYYTFMSTTVKARKQYQVWNFTQTELWSDDNVYAFSRGPVLVITTNAGGSSGTTTRTIPNVPFSAGATVCNIYYPTADCIKVNSDKSLTVGLLHGEPKVYFQQ